MTGDWLKRYAPRSLYARAALILLLPVIGIQLAVSVIFIQRHYEDVTRQMTGNLMPQLQLVLDRVAARADVAELADRLEIAVTVPAAEPIRGDRRVFYDLSGRSLIARLRRDLPGITGIDLASDDDFVRFTLPTPRGLAELRFDRDRVSASNPHQLLVLMVFVSLLMTVIAYLFLRNQLRPVRRLARAAEAFGKGRTVAYKPSGAVEVRAAGSAFLDMRGRIERQIEQRTLLLSGVSHDLRTPLTRMKLGLSMMEGDDAAALHADVVEMQRMITTFLDFARSDALEALDEVDPAQMLEDVAARFQRSGHDVTIADLEGHGPAHLRPLALTRALENLVGNAVRHGSRALLGLAISERAVVFTVEDDGPGIPPEARDEAMRPFARLGAARDPNRGGGVGLGLSIAMDIARQHGGTLRLDRSARLGGLRADLVLAR